MEANRQAQGSKKIRKTIRKRHTVLFCMRKGVKGLLESITARTKRDHWPGLPRHRWYTVHQQGLYSDSDHCIRNSKAIKKCFQFDTDRNVNYISAYMYANQTNVCPMVLTPIRKHRKSRSTYHTDTMLSYGVLVMAWLSWTDFETVVHQDEEKGIIGISFRTLSSRHLVLPSLTHKMPSRHLVRLKPTTV